AEDGIRDDLVTGVQTCALPISPLARQFASFRRSTALEIRPRIYSKNARSRAKCWHLGGEKSLFLPKSVNFTNVAVLRRFHDCVRSEERRVGKEGIFRRLLSYR